MNVCVGSQPRPPGELIAWSLSYHPATICPPPPLSLCIIHIFCLHTHTSTHSLYHLWLTRDSRCHCQPWNVAAPSREGSPRVFAQWPQRSHQPKSSDIIHLLAAVCLCFSRSPRALSALCLRLPLRFSSAPPRAQRRGQKVNSPVLLGGLSPVVW